MRFLHEIPLYLTAYFEIEEKEKEKKKEREEKRIYVSSFN